MFLSKGDCSYAWYGCYQSQPTKSTAKRLKLEEFTLTSLLSCGLVKVTLPFLRTCFSLQRNLLLLVEALVLQ